jgi:hypothetical protein
MLSSYGDVINQIFHGWVGDVRIVNRALSVGEFMTARACPDPVFSGGAGSAR